MATRPQKTANEPLGQAGAECFNSTQSTPRVMIPPLVSHIRKALSAGCTSRNFGRSEKDHAAQRGRDACGTATRISASLFRRLSAFLGSTSNQDPKAARFAVLNPGHAEFPKRVKQSEGSDTTPTQNIPCFGVRAAVCDFSPKAEWCVPTFTGESKRGRLCRRC